MMKAYVLNGINELEYMELPMPKLDKGEVLVEVKAVGICGSDIPRIFETGTYHFPTIPGHEFSGVVHSVYDESLKHLCGKRVGVFPLIPCKECLPCRNKAYEMCMKYDYLGSRRDGGFAEYVAVPMWNLIELPEEVSFEAAAMLEPASVGIHALKRINMSTVKTVVIFGAGTIGVLMAQWLRILGAQSIFLVGTNGKQKTLLDNMGFGDFCNTNEEDVVRFILERTGGEGVDLAIECAGYASVLSECLDVVKRGGDILVVGNPHGDVELEKDVYWKLLRKQIRISGTWNSSFVPEDVTDDWKLTLEAMVNGKIKPESQITHRLPFDELPKGLEIMRTKREFYNKVMVII